MLSNANSSKLIDNDLIKMEVPDNWEMQLKDMGGNKTLATSKQTHDGWPVKMMMVEYCISRNSKNQSSLLDCKKPCSEQKLLDYMSKLKQFKKEKKISKKYFNNNQVEYTAEIGIDKPNEFATLKCSNDAQVFFWYISPDNTKSEYRKIISIMK